MEVLHLSNARVPPSLGPPTRRAHRQMYVPTHDIGNYMFFTVILYCSHLL